MASSSDDNGIQYTDTPCTICGDSTGYETDPFIACTKCKIEFHQSCYGLEKKQIDTNKFVCYYCKHKSKKKKQCQLCYLPKEGLASTTISSKDGKWGHVICAYSFNCKLDDASSDPLRNTTIDWKDIKLNKKGTCCSCNTSTGYKLECVHPKCSTKIHPSCARINANNDDSFYFDDIYNDTLFRNPVYFCTQHNIKINDDNALNKRQRALHMIKKWDKRHNKRKRKRETNDSDSPKIKKRKLSMKYEAVDSNDNDHESLNVEQQQDNISEYSPTLDMESEDDLIISTSEHNDSEYQHDVNMNNNTNNGMIEDDNLPLYNRNATIHQKPPKPKLSTYAGSKLANVHDFKYCLDKCYCFKCLNKQVHIKKEADENSDEIKMENENNDDDDADREWFNEAIWFERNYTLHDFDSKQKQKFTATFSENINISTDYSRVYNDDEDAQQKIQHTLGGYESISMYNYDAIHNNVQEETAMSEMPSKPFRKLPKNKETKSKSSLFYRKIYRDININCGGCVIAMDFNPICKYHNLNAFNYLAVFADCYNKYHAFTNEKDAKSQTKEYLIQIWKIKKRIRRKSKTTKHGWCKAGKKHRNAVFHYGITHCGGFIWDLKWLPFRINHKPSESHEANHNGVQYQRLGILAVCSADHFVYIYSLPFVAKDDTLMDINPVMKLSVTKHTFIRLAWSSNLIYPMLIASSNNGCVAIWDLRVMTHKMKENMNILCDQQLNLIQSHLPNESITGIDWCSDHLKYFITISQNGCLRLWDINHSFTPIFTRKVHSSPTDIQWILGLDSSLITTESYVSNSKMLANTGNEEILNQYSHFSKATSNHCTKLMSIWPQQYLDCLSKEHKKEKIDMESLSLPTLTREVTRNYSRMGSTIQFPAERLYNISDKLAFSVDVLLKCDCNNHGSNIDLTQSINDSSQLVSSDSVTLYVAVGYSSGNVILYEQKLSELANITQKRKGQIVSQLISDDNDKNECRLIGPFYGINSKVNKSQANVSRYIWTKENKNKPIYDPYYIDPKQLALNDNIAIRKVKLCPNGENIEVVSGSISGIIRIQTVES